MKKVSQILASRLKHHNLEKEATSALVCNAAGEIAKGEFTPISFKNGLLTLKVPNPQVAVQLRFGSSQIIEEINHKLGQKIVQKLKFRV